MKIINVSKVNEGEKKERKEIERIKENREREGDIFKS